MFRRFAPIPLVGLLLVNGCSPPSPPPPTTPKRTAPEIACFAPDLEGTDLEGKTHKLSDYRGKVVVVDFWGSWCGPCRMMIPQEKELVARMHGRPFAFVGVSADHSRDALRGFLEKDPHPWPDIYDGYGGPLARKWEIDGWPTFVFIDASGVIRYRETGGAPANFFDKRVEELMREVENR